MTWCDSAFLQGNVKKKKSLAPQPTRVKGQMVEWAGSYMYLGLFIEKSCVSILIVKQYERKARLHCLRRLST